MGKARVGGLRPLGSLTHAAVSDSRESFNTPASLNGVLPNGVLGNRSNNMSNNIPNNIPIIYPI